MRGQCSGQSRVGGRQPSAVCPGWGGAGASGQRVAPAALQMARAGRGLADTARAQRFLCQEEVGTFCFPCREATPAPSR